MKRILIIAGIFVGLGLAAVVVVFATRQDVSDGTNATVDISPGKQIVVPPAGGYARMSVVGNLPKTNAAAVPVRQ